MKMQKANVRNKATLSEIDENLAALRKLLLVDKRHT